MSNKIPDEIEALKSRDSNQDTLYFYNFLQRIKPFAERTFNGYADTKRNNNALGIKNWARGLSEGIVVKPSIWYSMGTTINNSWQNYYLENIKYYQECISSELINGSYQLILQILAMGILLNIDKSVFKKYLNGILKRDMNILF